MFRIVVLFFLLFLSNCSEHALPKPKAYLRLSYPINEYQKVTISRPYSFEVSKIAQTIDLPKKWLKIEYPDLKASIAITYRPVQNNLRELFMEAEKLVFEHTIKADQISSKNFENNEKRVFGKLFEISGNAASQVQFHVTDSAKHFLKGSLFFKTRPNYDSVLPAVAYIKKDMVRIMESLEWQK